MFSLAQPSVSVAPCPAAPMEARFNFSFAETFLRRASAPSTRNPLPPASASPETVTAEVERNFRRLKDAFAGFMRKISFPSVLQVKRAGIATRLELLATLWQNFAPK